MKMLYKVVFGALLAATLVLVSCEDSAATTTVSFPAIAAPKVTAAAIQDGVKLEWSGDIEASGYIVYRRQDGGSEDVYVTNSISTDPTTGKRYVRDLQSDSTNSVKANTKYTYTVKANPASSHKESATGNATITTNATFLAKGAELAPPSAVAIELLPDANSIKATVTPGEHADLAFGYWVSILRDGQSFDGVWINYPETTGVYTWEPDDQISGTYTAQVLTANANTETFYTFSKYVASAENAFESLFGANFGASVDIDDVVTGAGANVTTVAYYSASISLNGLQPGVAYSVERAPTNKLGYATDDYKPVTLSKYVSSSGDYSPATSDDLTSDHLGNLAATYFYDRGVPAESGYYVYRVKAVKGNVTQYKPKDGAFLSIDLDALGAFASQIIGISVAAKDTSVAGRASYAVTPSLAYKNVLPSDGKLVIYWVKGDGSSYRYGKYSNKIEFSKAELEAATVAPKSITVLDSADGSYVSAQAYVEFTDGTRKNLTDYSWTSGGGVSYSSNYWDSNIGGSIYYARFNY